MLPSVAGPRFDRPAYWGVMQIKKMNMILELLNEYKKQLIAIVVSSISFTVVYEWLVSIFYLKSWSIPRAVVAIVILLIILGGVHFYQLWKKLKELKNPKLSENMEFVLWMHKDVPLGNGQCASTLIEGQDSVHIQEAQYCLDELFQMGYLRVINNPDPDEEERLYSLAEPGRRYLVETGLLYRDFSNETNA